MNLHQDKHERFTTEMLIKRKSDSEKYDSYDANLNPKVDIEYILLHIH